MQPAGQDQRKKTKCADRIQRRIIADPADHYRCEQRRDQRTAADEDRHGKHLRAAGRAHLTDRADELLAGEQHQRERYQL